MNAFAESLKRENPAIVITVTCETFMVVCDVDILQEIIRWGT